MQPEVVKRVSVTPKTLNNRSFIESRRRSPAPSYTSKDHSIEESHLMLNNFMGPLGRLTSQRESLKRDNVNTCQLWSRRQELWYKNENRLVFACHSRKQRKAIMGVILAHKLFS